MAYTELVEKQFGATEKIDLPCNQSFEFAAFHAHLQQVMYQAAAFGNVDKLIDDLRAVLVFGLLWVKGARRESENPGDTSLKLLLGVHGMSL